MMPIRSLSSWVRRSGGVSTRRLPPGSPSTSPQRVRLFRGLPLVQVAQPHPITGTPTEVPVPRNTSLPRRSIVAGDSGIEKILAIGSQVLGRFPPGGRRRFPESTTAKCPIPRGPLENHARAWRQPVDPVTDRATIPLRQTLPKTAWFDRPPPRNKRYRPTIAIVVNYVA